MSKTNKIKELESLVYSLELELKKAKLVLGELTGDTGKKAVDYSLRASEVGAEREEEGKIIVEGVFNGQIMVGPDGKNYSVPANYASKSKLVEGDILKLTIEKDGSFIFKQISPVERKRLVGHLVKDKETNEYVALAGDRIYKILLASVTYFKGNEGDEIVILVPKDADSNWAAVENIIRARRSDDQDLDTLELDL